MFYCTLIPDSYSHWACPSLSMAEKDNAWWNPYLGLGSRLFSEILAQTSSHCFNYPLTHKKNGKIHSSFSAPYVQTWTRLSLFLKILSSYMSVQTVRFSFQCLQSLREYVFLQLPQIIAYYCVSRGVLYSYLWLPMSFSWVNTLMHLVTKIFGIKFLLQLLSKD